MESSFISATILVMIGLSFTLWMLFVSLFRPTQWLNPSKKTLLITGCDSGIGLELARYFHNKGSIVIATVLSRDTDAVRQLASLSNDEAGVFIVEVDLRHREALKNATVEIKHLLEDNQLNLHALINNAGVCVFSEFDFSTEEQVDEQLSVNLMGTIHFTKLLLPLVIQNRGRIVNVTSVNALQTFPGIAVYSATKRGLEAFGDSLRMELAKFGVKVISIRLGDFAKLTNIMANHRRTMEAQRNQWNQEKWKYYEDDYFDRYHELALQDYGTFSPPSYHESSLFDDFEEALFAVKPSNYKTSAVFWYKVLLYIVSVLPSRTSDAIINYYVNKSMHK